MRKTYIFAKNNGVKKVRDPGRISRILDLLEEVWILYPDMRLGQLIENIYGCQRNDPNCIFNREDDEIEEMLKEFLKTRKFTRGRTKP